MGFSRYEHAFRRIIVELRPYLDEIVIIGGWVPYLYKRYGWLHFVELKHLAYGRGGRAGGSPVTSGRTTVHP